MRRWIVRSGIGLITIALSGLAMATAAGAATTAPAVTAPPYYQLVNHDGKCLDVPGGATGVVVVQQWGCNGNSWQYWDVYPSGSQYGGYLIKNYHSQKCLSVDGNYGPGAAVKQENCTPGSLSQNWYAEYTGSGEWFQYWAAGSNIGGNEETAMHPSDGSTSDGKSIYAQFPNSANNLASFSWKLGAQE